MSNTLTKIAPVLYSAAQEVSSEPFGIIQNIATDFNNQGVAIGDKVKVSVAPTRSTGNYSPNMNLNAGSTGTAATAGAEEVSIDANKVVTWHLTGEQMRSLENGNNYDEWVRQLVAQGMRALRNGAEKEAAKAIKIGASRATGEAGVTPFATSLKDAVAVRKILRNNGAPLSDVSLAFDSSVEANLLNLGIVQQAYAAGSEQERRRGVLLPQMGMRMVTTAGMDEHDAGTTSTEYQTNAQTNASLTTIVVKEGSGSTIKAGDVFQIEDDPAGGLYVANADVDDNTDDLLINRPGLLAQVDASKEITLEGDYTPALAFERNAVVAVMRPPLIPNNANINQIVVTDQFGMSYLFCEVIGDGVITWRLHLAYGFKVVQPEHVAILMG